MYGGAMSGKRNPYAGVLKDQCYRQQVLPNKKLAKRRRSQRQQDILRDDYQD